eukprot:COSAG02_NODE_21798_length_774_cov_2.645926_1_plen_113_part_00
MLLVVVAAAAAAAAAAGVGGGGGGAGGGGGGAGGAGAGRLGSRVMVVVGSGFWKSHPHADRAPAARSHAASHKRTSMNRAQIYRSPCGRGFGCATAPMHVRCPQVLKTHPCA